MNFLGSLMRRRDQPSSHSDRVLNAALLHLVCRFERLVVIATLQNHEAKQPSNRLISRDGGQQVERDLRRRHQQIFDDWLCLSSNDQVADLETYAEIRGEAPAAVASKWLALGARDTLMPEGIMSQKKQLFYREAEALLSTLLATPARLEGRQLCL